ncbi:hypothetical protein IQ07DRAFT_189340 [Pyrenochaeta sp. DS3sAY3a]|nr:hypothetical protein IQ07DRAFT_189340 [Pyrenochaeta sp. DS3sAY3a]
MAMPTCEIVQTTPTIEARAGELALLLPKLKVQQIPTKDDRMRWFRYIPDQKCTDKLEELLLDLRPIIKLAVERCANAAIIVDRSPQPTLERLDFGWAQVPPNFSVFLLSCASNDCKEPVFQTRKDLKASESCVVKWDCGSGVVVPELFYYITEPAGVPYYVIPIPTPQKM